MNDQVSNPFGAVVKVGHTGGALADSHQQRAIANFQNALLKQLKPWINRRVENEI